MSNIAEFPRQDELSPVEKLRKQFWKRVRARIYTIILIAALVAAAVFAYISYEKRKIYTNIEVLKSVPFAMSSGEVVDFAGNILTYSKDGAQAMDADGNLLWNRTFDMQNPMYSICGGTVAFADYGGTSIYVQTNSDDGYEINTDMPIRKITTSDNGMVAAVLEDVGVTWIYLYDSNGETVAYFRTTMEKSGYPVDLDISPKGELVGISYYYLDVADVKDSVAFYNFGEVGQNKIDNFVSGYNYTSLVPILRFLSDDVAFSVASDRLDIYEGSQKPVSIKDEFINQNIVSVYYDSSHIALVVRDSAEAMVNKVKLYSKKGDLLSSYDFDFDCRSIAFAGDRYVLYGINEFNVIDEDGKLKMQADYGREIHLVIPTSVPTKFVVVTDTSIDTIQIK